MNRATWLSLSAQTQWSVRQNAWQEYQTRYMHAEAFSGTERACFWLKEEIGAEIELSLNNPQFTPERTYGEVIARAMRVEQDYKRNPYAYLKEELDVYLEYLECRAYTCLTTSYSDATLPVLASIPTYSILLRVDGCYAVQRRTKQAKRKDKVTTLLVFTSIVTATLARVGLTQHLVTEKG